MRLTRCFIATPLSSESVVTLPAETAARLIRVLRLRAGAELTLFDGRGGEYTGRLLDGDDPVRVQVGAHHSIEREAPLYLTLLQCLARGDRMDWIVQKATELGVAVIVPVISRYTVVQLDPSARQRRLAHWQTVSISACEQCGRNRLPTVQPIVELSSAWAAAGVARARLLLSPKAPVSLPAALAGVAKPAGTVPLSVTLLIGPEGGLASEEQDAADRHGFQACRLGPRVLRAETAPVAALASIQAVAGDFI